jgi:hypothetical protein
MKEQNLMERGVNVVKEFIEEVYANLKLCTEEKELVVVNKALEVKPNVLISHNNEAGYFQWSVMIEGTDFWIDSFGSKAESIDFCEEVGLPIIEVV